MVRTQVSLSADQMARLRRLARERGVSIAALLREGVEHVLDADGRSARHRRALETVGVARDRADVSARHDRYLDDAYDA